MTLTTIIVLKEASVDLKMAKNFYESQSRGLGDYFKDSIISDIESLYLYGGIHFKVYGLYRLLSKRFPYGIYYDIIDSEVRIIAILDLRQNPKNIKDKIYTRDVFNSDS